MTRRVAQAVVTRLRTQASDHLRSVAYFEGKTRERLYVRDDIADASSDDAVEAVFTDLSFDALGKAHTEQVYGHGELNCIVRHFDEAIELHFPRGRESGVAVAVDPDAAADLERLIEACLTELDEDHLHPSA